jgi:hypothetical protein
MEKRALERSTVCRCSVRREHDLDRQREQRPQSLDDLLAGDAPRNHCGSIAPTSSVGENRTRRRRRGDVLDQVEIAS